MRILKLIVCLVLLLSGISMHAQDSSPVSFTVRQEQISEKEIQVIFEAEIAAGWHVYSTDMPDGGQQSGTGLMKEKDEELNQRFLIYILPKPGQIANDESK